MIYEHGSYHQNQNQVLATFRKCTLFMLIMFLYFFHYRVNKSILTYFLDRKSLGLSNVYLLLHTDACKMNLHQYGYNCINSQPGACSRRKVPTRQALLPNL